VAVDPSATPEFARQLYRFDFSCVAAGIHGYSWSFPCLISGRPHLNLGVYDQLPREVSVPGRPARALREQLRAAFPEVAMAEHGAGCAFKAFPIRWFDPANRYATERVLLAGDAAGIDPLMGEGISYAFEHGKLAAAAIARLLDGDCTALETYGRQLHVGFIGRKLRRLAFAARRFYGARHRFYFRLAGLSGGLQRMGVDWYNGAHRLDELSVVRAGWRRAFRGI